MRLEAWIKLKGITIADAARLFEVRRVSVHRYIAKTRIPRPKVLEQIRKATDGAVTPNDFI
jgi:hypothetical protein